MAASPPLDDRREALLKHLGSVYTLARALARDHDRAVGLVEATYAQAFVTRPPHQAEEDDKRWLLHLARQVHREQEADAWTAHEAAPPADADALDGFRERLAAQVAERALPAVFASLPEEQRLVLLLCDVEELPCADAAGVLDLDADAACRLLEEARSAVAHGLRAGAAPMERHVLDASLPDDDLRRALRRTVEAAYGSSPATLRASVLEAAEAAWPTPPAAPQEPPAPDPPRLLLPPTASPDARPVPRRGAFRPPLRRLLLTLLLVGVVGLAGLLTSRSLQRSPETNLIALAVQQADAIRPTLPTDSPPQAEAYILGHLGWRLTLPAIDETALRGVGVFEITRDARIPVFLYDDLLNDDAPAIVLYVLTYALLDRFEDRLVLEPGIRRQIQEADRFDLHDLGTHQVLVWRNRDDIYVAVTTGDAEALQERIVFPS